MNEFLSDLPRYHCAVKPPHSFCTVCVRINTSVGMDCPLREEGAGQPAARGGAPPALAQRYAQGTAPEYDEAQRAPVAHIPAAAVIPDAPVIEFAKSTEPHKPRKRMKARPVQKRSAAEHAPGDEGGAPRRMDADDRVWATHEGPGSADSDEERELREWDPESSGAPPGSKGPRPPRPPKDA